MVGGWKGSTGSCIAEPGERSGDRLEKAATSGARTNAVITHAAAPGRTEPQFIHLERDILTNDIPIGGFTGREESSSGAQMQEVELRVSQNKQLGFRQLCRAEEPEQEIKLEWQNRAEVDQQKVALRV
ncbi:hypothetical protein HPP92_016004 [Vanilla planifolia]|uniref:Uncharacterized protein n=1 Tax=Vanilla planifolia TaxID=51239 RepID=A0A835URN9_VANPL|nr:hypothetical protein HPP92_016621 [Vanilla planifolia]KAG0471458.1 hypothetical protein HPP92_016004 [Vanilla planifolia]